MDRRGDDLEFAVAWESDGTRFREVQRIPLSCPNVELAVPNRGPFVYEARLSYTPFTLHPECSCLPGQTCPNGVQMKSASKETPLTSPVFSHFVVLKNEWKEYIGDQAILGHLTQDLDVKVVAVSRLVANATAGAPAEAALACPGSRDDSFGDDSVTLQQLSDSGMRLPVGHVEGAWCLVDRGGCSETAKAKVCEVSGAAGVIIVDHGNRPGDQEITIQYSRAANEWRRTLPILFVSAAEGAKLRTELATGNLVTVAVGPSVGGPAPPGYHPGSGITVHRISGAQPAGQEPVRKIYPDIFGTCIWLQVSAIRDILFVCQHAADTSEVVMYDVSDPLNDISLLGTIKTKCAWAGSHDYKVLDFKGQDGRFMTALVDPLDRGNSLQYYDTDDPAQPKLKLTLHANWESPTQGLGQVRPGGPNGRYHLVTWHCSTIYCDKSHGHTLHVLDSWNLTQPPYKIPLPMMSKGSYARDVACGDDAVCLMSLTWDGVVAIDSGVDGSANPLQPVASLVNALPFTDVHIPLGDEHLKLMAGAQKVYPSRKFPRVFYVEHADFSVRHFRMEDWFRSLITRNIYAVRLDNYDASVMVPGYEAASQEPAHPGVGRGNGERDAGRRGGPGGFSLLLLGLSVGISATLICFVVLLLRCLARERRLVREQKAELERVRGPFGGADAAENGVVVGRPVAEGEEPAAHPGTTRAAQADNLKGKSAS
eukprot:TRINITY_DN22899_c0_g2_i1.p1 TRINITY_DN22899_c0_g2~~TRINITY_DN22899_c0_g2_i1.p1  ORF type:complete len:813 (-),score=117.51 TRINITY_DN22899_c0_g2_i1:112-2238(-)